MITIKNLARRLVQLTIFSCIMLTVSAQDDKKIPESPQRPKFATNIRSVNVSAIDNVVTLSFELLKSVDEISLKVQVIKDQLQNSISDPSLLVTQIDECSNALVLVSSTSPALAESVANMIGNFKDLHIPIMKIPSALKNLNEARKAVQYCIGYSKYLISSAIPDMKNMKQKTDSTSTQLMANN